MTIVTSSPEETFEAGRRIARTLEPPQTVLLIGELGAGKTTLAKGIVSELGAARPEDVASPTYTLIHEYGGRDGAPKVYHIDLYRLDRVPELETLGLEDVWDRDDAVVLIEWGEKFSAELPGRRVEVLLRYLDDERREIQMTSASLREPRP